MPKVDGRVLHSDRRDKLSLSIIPSQGPVESSEVAHHAKKITTVEIPWQAPTRN
jgi:hypothetical protein